MYIYLGADIIRLLRNTNVMFREITVFFFPKKDEKTSIASIKVKWENSRFVYTLKRHETMESGIEEVNRVLVENVTNVPVMPTNVSDYLIQLTQDEMKEMCGKSKSIQSCCTQLDCHPRHIMVQCSGSIYKLVYDKDEFIALHDLQMTVTSTPKYFVVPRAVPYKKFLFTYPIVHFNPLEDKEASQCLRTLVMKVKVALDELHSYGFSHNDVRVANIAFNKNYEAVLIDLDRCYDISELHPYFRIPKLGCMYNWVDNNILDNGEQTDFFQLGWLVMWLLDKKDSYHDRKWEDHSQRVRDDLFIKSLILEGKFNAKHLDASILVRDEVEDFKTIFSSDISD